MSDIVLRKAGLLDLEAILEIDQSVFPEGISYDAETFLFYLIDPATSVVATEVQGSIAGFIIFREQSAKTGCVVTIDVAKEFQGRGFGSSLLNEAETVAVETGFSSIILQTAVNNIKAIHFYEKRGYTRSRRIKGYYFDGTDAWEMRKKLPANDVLIGEN